mmetsp:Transcript_12426/g.32924  ORF Transcript_12426/g.32924 Transcript_12426/m.32924 type:complete len:301 (+) Transcript_12426:86-988(+)
MLGFRALEHVEMVADLLDRVQIKFDRNDGFICSARLLDDVAQMVRDEARPIKRNRRRIQSHGPARLLDPDPIRRHHRHGIRRGVPLHDPLPMSLRVDPRVLRLRPDRRRIADHLRAHHREDPRGLGKPLIPADRNAQRSRRGLEDLEAGVALREVELLEVAGALRDVGLAVEAEVLSVRVEDDEGVEVALSRSLEKRDGKHDGELLGEVGEVVEQRVVLDGVGQSEVVLDVLAEVERLEELLEEDHVGAVGRSFADEALRDGNVLGGVRRARELGDGKLDVPAGDHFWVRRRGAGAKGMR